MTVLAGMNASLNVLQVALLAFIVIQLLAIYRRM